jgi:hypothetical protein
MKKFLLIVVLLWVGFLCFIIFKDKIQAFFSEEEPESKEIVAQAPAKVVTKSEPVMEKEKVAVPEPLKLKPVTEEEEVPFEPLPQMQLSKKDEDAVEEQIAQNKLPDPKKMVVADYNKDPFGLVCTKFSRLPSRFRLASWEGSKKVFLEDLENFDHLTNAYPKHTFTLNVPYKELKHASTGKSRFMICKSSDPNKRLMLLSLNIKYEALAYSAGKKPIAFLVIKDYKLGGAPYQVTNEMDKPLTSAYALEFEQFNGPQKFFHDLTGKPMRHPFGGWGFEFKILGTNFPDRSISVQRKNQKTGKITRKDILGPS